MILIRNRILKPKKSAHELIEMLRDQKGVLFSEMSEADAETFLSTKNNYLRTASYRKNYDKHTSGENEGKYIHLDFAYLAELSSLDLAFRSQILPMCIDIEHALKVKIVSAIESNPKEDGYSICDEFLAAYPYARSSIEEKADSIFTGELIDKYFDLCLVYETSASGKTSFKTRILSCDCPVWVFVEIVSFSTLVQFITFYNRKYPKSIPIDTKIVNPVRSLRNACAHNNCLFNNMRPCSTQPSEIISQFVSTIPTVAKEERKKKLKCRPLFEFSCLMYLYHTVVTEKVRKRRMAKLKEFIDHRLFRNADYFSDNQIVRTSLIYIKKLVDNFA